MAPEHKEWHWTIFEIQLNLRWTTNLSFFKAAQFCLCESAFPEGRPTSQYYIRPVCGILCIVQSCYHYKSRCRWNTQGHSKARNVPELPMEGSVRADDTRGAYGKAWSANDESCQTVEFRKQPGRNHPCNMCPSAKIETRQPEARRWRRGTDGGPSTTANKITQQEEKILPIHKIMSTVFPSWSWSVFGLHIFTHIFLGFSQQLNKTMTQEICCGCLKLMCEELMMESYLNAAILELQFEERFNV